MPLALGPGFTPADDASVAPAEAVIGYRTWQLRFESDPAVVGRPIVVNGAEFVVVGVAPPRFRGHIGDMDEPHDELWLQRERQLKAFAEQVHRQQQATPSPGRPAKPSGASGWARAADKPEPPAVGTTLPLF